MASNVKTGLFLSTTPIFDVGDLNNAQQSKELIIRLTQKINDIILSLNLCDKGYYTLTEFVNGQVFFPDPNLGATTPLQPLFRQVFRLVVDTGQLPNAGALVVPHNLKPTDRWSFTRIYGAASDTTGFNYIPLPYASLVLADNISLDVDATNVTITTGSDRTNFNMSYVVLEYIKN